MPSFPREIFRRRFLTSDMDEFLSLANKYNGLTHIYYALYSCDEKHNFSYARIDKIAFDFDDDNPENKIVEVIKLHEWLLQQDYKHILFFSGKKGFHVIIFANDDGVINKKIALRNSQLYITNLLEINPDDKIIGDIKRIFRLPNTFHISGKKYCIPITIDDLKIGYQHILNKANYQASDFVIYGHKLFNLKDFDNEEMFQKYNFKGTYDEDFFDIDYKIKLVDDEKIINSFLPCVKSWLHNKKNNDGEEMGNWQARYLFAIYCRDIGLPISEAERIAKKYFGKVKREDGNWTNYDHMLKTKVFEYAYNRDDTFWNCDTLIERGLCKGKCKHYKKGGSPLYK